VALFVCVLCVLDSYMCAHLHALALELVHTPGGGRSAGAAVRGSVSSRMCVFGTFVCAANTHTYLVVGVRGSLCLCRCVC